MDPIVTETNMLEKVHRLALENQIAFASYKLPDEPEVITIIQWKTQPAMISDILSLEGKSGFVFAPFDLDSEYPIRLIKPDIIMRGNKFDDLDFRLDPMLTESNFTEMKAHYSTNADPQVITMDAYMHQVDELRKMIGESLLDKVVLSRISIEKKPDGFNPTLLFEKLQNAYPEAFVFMIYIADAGLWFGASPEPLMIMKDKQISTVSLAGTRVYETDADEKPWGEKEFREQEIVTEYIESILEKSGVNKYSKEGPVSHRAGNVEHLKTSFAFESKELGGNPLQFVKKLHPTPSVCGLPKEMALDVIKRIEKHKREYYTGFLGPVNFENKWHLYVNLRSMKVDDHQFCYFLGAGITSGSDPYKEWEETRNKKNTLQNIVQSLNRE
ncbi:MAG: isochorismate synthase [Bacteroidales bacterium]|nr:isochorismate synthase [Bacteroidales bacterium]